MYLWGLGHSNKMFSFWSGGCTNSDASVRLIIIIMLKRQKFDELRLLSSITMTYSRQNTIIIVWCGPSWEMQAGDQKQLFLLEWPYSMIPDAWLACTAECSLTGCADLHVLRDVWVVTSSRQLHDACPTSVQLISSYGIPRFWCAMITRTYSRNGRGPHFTGGYLHCIHLGT